MPMRPALVLLLGVALAIAADAGAQSEPTPAADSKPVEAVQQQIVAQPELMEAVTELQADPEVQDVLGDPEVSAALQAGNIEALLTNPKILNLAKHPKVQAITRKLAR